MVTPLVLGLALCRCGHEPLDAGIEVQNPYTAGSNHTAALAEGTDLFIQSSKQKYTSTPTSACHGLGKGFRSLLSAI